MSNHFYADGAIHEDHHQEITINGNITVDAVRAISKDFFAANNAVEDVKVVENDLNDDDFPASVKEIFRQPAFVEKYVKEMIRCYYNDAPKNLALMYCVLRDYCILTHEFEPRTFISSLIDWNMLEPMDDKTLKTKSDGMASYLYDRTIDGKTRSGLTTDFKSWTNEKDKQKCEKIASVFGEAEGKTIHYKNYEKIMS